MANWTAENPGEIDSGALATTATTIQTTETSLSEARTVADTARAGISDAIWTGDAAAAWTSSLATPIGKIDAVLPEMTAVRTAIATYTTTVDDIKTRATSYKETIVQASLTAMVQYLDPVGGPDPTQQALRDQQHQNALNDKATAERLLEALTAERETADAALVSALSSPGGDSWDQQQAALAAIGITSAAGLSPSGIAKGMADLAAELGHGTFDADAAAQLQSLYSLYGNDPTVMAQMNLALGGEDLISLINRIDEAGANEWMAPGAALLLAQSVRGGLSVGSQRWTDAVGQNFAQELYDGSAAVHGTDSWTSLAFLFGDEHGSPIGVTTTVGLADIADEVERGNLGANADMYGPGQGIMGPDGFLSLAEAEQAGYDVNRLGDWTSRVFSTLGEYPVAAYDWLTEGGADPFQDSPQYTDRAGLSDPYPENATLGENRVEYWFGRRDSHLDGFEGVLALWSGAEHYPGGPNDASGEADPAAYTMVANLSHDVIGALVGEPREAEAGEWEPGNPHFVSENLSELGAVKLVEALAPQIPGIVEWPLAGDEIGVEAADQSPVNGSYPYGFDPVSLGLDPNDFTRYDYVNLSKEQLTKVLGMAGQNEAGATALAEVVGSYQDTLAATAQAGLVSPAEAADRITVLQGQLDGATTGVAVSAAGRHDAAVESALDLVETGVGMLPIPGLDKIVGATGDAVLDYVVDQASGYTTGQLIGAAKDLGGSVWGGQQDILLNRLGEDEIPREQDAKIHLAQFLWGLEKPEGVPDPSGMDHDELLAWVMDPDNRAVFDAMLGERDLTDFLSRYEDSYGNAYNNGKH